MGEQGGLMGMKFMKRGDERRREEARRAVILLLLLLLLFLLLLFSPLPTFVCFLFVWFCLQEDGSDEERQWSGKRSFGLDGANAVTQEGEEEEEEEQGVKGASKEEEEEEEDCC